MAIKLKPFNSIGGFSVGEGQNRVIDANLNATLANISATGGVTVDGGLSVLDILATGNANIVGSLSSLNLTTGDANITGIANVGSSLGVVGNVYAGAVLTDTLLYANGLPWQAGEYGDANVQVFLSSGNVTDATVIGNVVAGNFNTSGILNATSGIISGGAVNVTGAVSATGAVTGSDLNTAGIANVGSLVVTTTSSLNGAVTAGSSISATGDITTSGFLAATSGVSTAGNVQSLGISTGTISASGTITGQTGAFGSVSSSGNVTAAGLTSNGDISAFGSVTAPSVVATTVSATGVVSSPSVAGTTVSAGSLDTVTTARIGTDLTVLGSANVVGGFLSANISTGAISATGNIDTLSALNVASVANVGSLSVVAGASVGSDLLVLGNGNVVGTFTSGAATVASLVSSDFANVTGNLNVGGIANVAGNLVVAGSTLLTEFQATGNGIVNGNLTITGNLTYRDIQNVFSSDPTLTLGTGANGAPLTSDDGLDRGVVFDYYAGQDLNSALIWQHSSNTFQLASNVTWSNGIASISSLGDLYVSTLVGNVSAGVINATGNISTAGNIVAAANIDAANLNISGTFNAGTIAGDNISTPGNVSAGGNVVVTGSVTGQNINGYFGAFTNVTTQAVAFPTGSGSIVNETAYAFSSSNVANTSVFVGPAYTDYQFVVRGKDQITGATYVSSVNVDQAGDYVIFNNIGTSLGVINVDVYANLNQTYVNVVPYSSNATTWLTQVTIIQGG